MTDTRGDIQYSPGDKLTYLRPLPDGTNVNHVHVTVLHSATVLNRPRYTVEDDRTGSVYPLAHPDDLRPRNTQPPMAELAAIERAMIETGMPKPPHLAPTVSLLDWITYGGQQFKTLREDLHLLRAQLIELGADESLTTVSQARAVIQKLRMKVLAPTDLEQSIGTILLEHGVPADQMPLDRALEMLLSGYKVNPPTAFVPEARLRELLRSQLHSVNGDDLADLLVTALDSLGLGVANKSPDAIHETPTWEEVKAAFGEMGEMIKTVFKDVGK